MSRKSEIELTNMCLLYQEDKLLVQEKHWQGEVGYVFPGGHVEEGESLLDSVIREMKEETGLDIFHPVPCGFKDWIQEDGSRYIVLLYKTDRFSGSLKSSDEGRVLWVTRKEFERMHAIWNAREILRIMDGDEKSEFFFRLHDGQYEGQLLG